MERDIPGGSVNPDQGVAEVGSNPSTHPLNRGGWKAPTAGEIAATTDPDRPIDWSVFRTVSGMDAGGE